MNGPVHSRLIALENAVKELRRENQELRVHLGGQLQNLVREATSTIQASLRMPHDGKDGVDGKDGATGLQGIQGPPGKDCTMPTESELHEAVLVARKALIAKHAKFLGAIDHAISENGGSSSVQKIVRARLEQVKRDAGLD